MNKIYREYSVSVLHVYSIALVYNLTFGFNIFDSDSCRSSSVVHHQSPGVALHNAPVFNKAQY